MDNWARNDVGQDDRVQYSSQSDSRSLARNEFRGDGQYRIDGQMDNTELVLGKLEAEFDQMLVEMKSFLLKVPHKPGEDQLYFTIYTVSQKSCAKWCRSELRQIFSNFNKFW